jgi:hypothetical protein
VFLFGDLVRSFTDNSRWILFQIGYFPKSAGDVGIPFKTKYERIEAINAFVSPNEWLVLWWLSLCIGYNINLRWYYQDHFAGEESLWFIKTRSRENFKMRLVVILEACFFTLIDYDARRGGSWRWGDGEMGIA